MCLNWNLHNPSCTQDQAKHHQAVDFLSALILCCHNWMAHPPVQFLFCIVCIFSYVISVAAVCFYGVGWLVLHTIFLLSQLVLEPAVAADFLLGFTSLAFVPPETACYEIGSADSPYFDQKQDIDQLKVDGTSGIGHNSPLEYSTG